MIDDELQVSGQFRAAFHAEVPVGAASRLRAQLLRIDEPAPRPIRPRTVQISLRVVAVFALLAVLVAAAGAFMAIHLSTTPAGHGAHGVPRAAWGMVTADVGYEATSWLDPYGSHHILRTDDAGVHWRDVSPRASKLEGDPTAVYLLDTNHVWVAYTHSTGTETLVGTVQTADGGRTWHDGRPWLTGTSSAMDFDFVDARNGWMIVGSRLDVGTTPAPSILYRTVDGGATWAEIGRTKWLTKGSCFWGVPAFISPLHGWMSQGCWFAETRRDDTLVTRDGGVTWSPTSLPIPSCGTCDSGSFVAIFDSLNAVLEIATPDGKQGYLLFTTDGGESWTARSIEVAAGFPQFVDPAHGWAYGGEHPGLYRTLDGGKSWSLVRSSLPFGTSQSDLYFVDAESGFAEVPTNDLGTTSDLWKTTDGGSTWSRVGPLPTSA